LKGDYCPFLSSWAERYRRAAMNAQLFDSRQNSWLASVVSLALITTFFVCVLAVRFTATAAVHAINPWRIIGVLMVGGVILISKFYFGAREAGWQILFWRPRIVDYQNTEKHIRGTRFGPDENGRAWPSRRHLKSDSRTAG